MREAPELAALGDLILGRPVNTGALSADDWSRLVAAAEWHRLVPMLHSGLEGSDEAPAHVRDALERSYLANVARNMFVSASGDEVFAALRAAQIPTLPLKGVLLIGDYYANSGLRELWDIDVLVPRDQLAAAEAVLVDLGYREGQDAGRAKLPRGLRAADHHEPALVSPNRFTAVELHHHIATRGEGRDFEIGDLWERAVESKRFGHAPAPDDLLLHLSLHFSRNRLVGRTAGALAQIADIALVVEQDDVDWERFVASARAYSLELRIFLALVAAAELGVSIPEHVLGALRPQGFDADMVSAFLRLRVLRADEHQSLHPLRRILLPRRDRIATGYRSGTDTWPTLARAYADRARARKPQVISTLRRPLTETIRDYRLSGRISTLENRN